MIGYIAQAHGSPCPTLTLDASKLPTRHDDLIAALARARAELVAAGHANVLKFALISPAQDPRFDLDYTFVQCLPGKPDWFDTQGSCGHSILCSIMVARHLHWLGRLAPETKIRVNVVNNGDNVVCEVEETAWPHAGFTAYFMSTTTARLGDALPTREPVTEIAFEGGYVPVSIASVANPYAFVHAAMLGIRSQHDLFAGGLELYDRVVALRAGVTDRLGLPSGGAFPKLAVIGQYEPGLLAVRALSIPTWHPTLALTGAVCLGVTTAIEHSIPYELARLAGAAPGAVTIQTPGSTTTVTAEVTGTSPDDYLRWTSVRGKRAHFVKRLSFDGLSERDRCPATPPADDRRRRRARRLRPAARSWPAASLA